MSRARIRVYRFKFAGADDRLHPLTAPSPRLLRRGQPLHPPNMYMSAVPGYFSGTSSATATFTSTVSPILTGARKFESLRNVNGARAWKSRAKHRGNKARGIKAMGDARAKWCLRGKMLGKMDRIAVPCDLGKADHIRGVDDLFKGSRSFRPRDLRNKAFGAATFSRPESYCSGGSTRTVFTWTWFAGDTLFESTGRHSCHASHSSRHQHLCINAARVGVFPEFGTKPARNPIARRNDIQPSLGEIRQISQRPPISSTLMNASAVNTAMVALVPLVSIKSAPADGASA